MRSRLSLGRRPVDPFEQERARARAADAARRAIASNDVDATMVAGVRESESAAPPPQPEGISSTPARRFPPPALCDDKGAGVGIQPSDRKYGTLVIGGQGMGKSSVLQRMILADSFDPNCAQIVIDLKSELIDGAGGGEGDSGLLSIINPDHGKPVYHLDLGDPRFGMSPLRLFGDAPLADEATRIAAAVTGAIGDLFEGQVFQSSERFLYYAVIGAVCLAYWEDRVPRFEDVAELLKPNAKAAHAAAARAVSDIPELYETYQFFGRDLPYNLEHSYTSTAGKMDPPGNKINLLVARTSVARFFSHPIDVPLRTIIAERGILLVDCNPAAVDIANAQAIALMILHQLHREMQRAMKVPESKRPRVATVIDEAHYVLHSENVIDQVATHRAAGADYTFGLQFFAQLGSGSNHKEKIRTGIWNLCQNKLLFRTSDPKDAEMISRAAMAIYNNRIETDPVSRGRMRVAPETLIQMRPYNCLALLIAHGDRSDPFIGHTFPMPRAVPGDWRDHHRRTLERRLGARPRTLPYRPRYNAETLGMVIDGKITDPAVRERVGADHGVINDRPDVDLDTGEVIDALTDAPSTSQPDTTPSPAADTSTPPDTSIPGQTALDDFLEPTSDEPCDEDPSAGEPVPADQVPAAAATPSVLDAPPAGLNVEIIRATSDQEESLVLTVAARGRARRDRGEQSLDEGALEAWAGSRSGGAKRASGDVPDSVRRLTTIDRIVAMGKADEGRPPAGPLPKLSEPKLQILAYLDRLGFALGQTIHGSLFSEKTPQSTRQHLADLRAAGLVASAPARMEDAEDARRPHLIHMLTGRGFAALREAGVVPERREFRAVSRRRPGPLVHDLHVHEYLAAMMRRLDGVATNGWRTPRQATGRLDAPTVGRGRSSRIASAGEIMVPHNQSVLDVSDDAVAEIKPDLIMEMRVGDPKVTFDVMVEVDVSGKTPRQGEKFRRYDAFLTAWWHTIDRYQDLGTRPLVLFTAQTERQLLSFVQEADREMTGRVGRVGWPMATWDFPGRAHARFALEQDMHHGDLTCLRLPAQPPRVRPDEQLVVERVQLIDPNLLPDA